MGYPQEAHTSWWMKGESHLTLSCSVTLEKRGNPFWGSKTVFNGAAAKNKGKQGATEQLSTGKSSLWSRVDESRVPVADLPPELMGLSSRCKGTSPLRVRGL